MDKVSLALFGKINKMFAEGDPNRFIAFNHAAVPYESTTFELNLHEEVNMPLNVSAFKETPGIDQYLWDPYGEALNNAEPISLDYNDDKWKEYNEQINKLIEMREAYLKHKMEYNDLVTERKGVQSALIELTDENSLKEKEDRIRILNTLIDEKWSDWKILGRKEEYERIEAEILLFEPTHPVQVIQKYREDLEAAEIGGDIASGQIVYSTKISPRDFFEENGSGWITFDLDKMEVDKFYQYAIDTLFVNQKDLIQPDENDDELEIERISGKIGVLKVIRPWLKQNFFHAGYWRLNTAYSRQFLSDGDPVNPKGRLPAYVDEVLFVKKLDIELTPKSEVNRETIEENQKNGTPIQLGNMLFKFPLSNDSGQITNISKPTRINSSIAKRYRDAAFQLRSFDRERRYSPTSKSNIKTLINVYHKLDSGDQNNAIIRTPIFDKSEIASKRNKANPKEVLGIVTKRNIIGANASSFKVKQSKVPSSNFRQMESQSEKRNTEIENNTNIQGSVHGFCGMVETIDGQPLRDVNILFIDTIDSQKQYEFTTNDQGKYEAVLPNKPYKVEIDHKGFFRYVTKLLPVIDQESNKLKQNDFILIKDSESEIEDQLNFLCLGVLCRKLPKSPNPDPSLPWE